MISPWTGASLAPNALDYTIDPGITYRSLNRATFSRATSAADDTEKEEFADGNRLGVTLADSLMPRPKTGKVGRVHRPCYGRLSPANAWVTPYPGIGFYGVS